MSLMQKRDTWKGRALAAAISVGLDDASIATSCEEKLQKVGSFLRRPKSFTTTALRGQVVVLVIIKKTVGRRCWRHL